MLLLDADCSSRFGAFHSRSIELDVTRTARNSCGSPGTRFTKQINSIRIMYTRTRPNHHHNHHHDDMVMVVVSLVYCLYDFVFRFYLVVLSVFIFNFEFVNPSQLFFFLVGLFLIYCTYKKIKILFSSRHITFFFVVLMFSFCNTLMVFFHFHSFTSFSSIIFFSIIVLSKLCCRQLNVAFFCFVQRNYNKNEETNKKILLKWLSKLIWQMQHTNFSVL